MVWLCSGSEVTELVVEYLTGKKEKEKASSSWTGGVGTLTIIALYTAT